MFRHKLYIIILEKTASDMFTTGARKKTPKKDLYCLDLKTW